MERKVKNELLVGLTLALVAFVIYSNSLGNGFVWDDSVVILANPVLKGSPLELFSSIDSARTTDLTPYYRPLTILSFLIEGRLHGFNPFLVRLFNVLLHTANTFLVYRLIRTFNVALPGAMIAGLLFALHPLQSEAVDFNAGGRNTMLAAFFILTTYLVHQWSVKQGSVYGALVASILFLAGLFSKETALVILPFIGATEIYGLCYKKAFSWRKACFRLVPYISCVLIYLILRNNAMLRAGVDLVIIPGLGERLLDNIYIIPRYLLNVVWPVLLSPKYFIPDDLHLYTLQLFSAWVFIVGMLLWFFTRGRSLPTLFGLAWIVAFWLPVSGIFRIPSAPLADRYLYVSAIGLWVLLADQLGRFLSTHATIRRWGVVPAAMVLIVLAAVTIGHNPVWHSDVSLSSRIIELYPEQAYGFHNLGCAYLDKEHNPVLAERSFAQAFALDPNFPRLRTQMGYIAVLRGDNEGALRHYADALKLNPFDAEAHLNSGIVLEKMLRYEEALIEYRRFLESPGNELADARLAINSKVLDLSQRPIATGHREKPL